MRSQHIDRSVMIDRRPKRPLKRRLRHFAIEWLPVLATVSLASVILLMTIQLVD
jgi:hypothetical protein